MQLSLGLGGDIIGVNDVIFVINIVNTPIICDGEVDECGICNGDGIADGAQDCDGNILDCAGETVYACR